MTRTERQDLLLICRQRARVAKTEATAIAERRKAEFEALLAKTYEFDQDKVWREMHDAAIDAWERANQMIEDRSKQLGIPLEFSPHLSKPYWLDRGENAVKERRSELARVAHRKIEALEKEAKHAIERASVEIQTQIVADGLESGEARAFLAKMPSADELIPTISIEEVKLLLPG
jgi:hypothetical protein